LILLQNDGAFAYHDPAVSPLFEMLLIPSLQHAHWLGDKLRAEVAKLTPSSPIQSWDFVPGFTLAAAPLDQRRRISGVLLLAAKRPDFDLNEDLQRLCSQMQLDAGWLAQQASATPGAEPRLLSNGLSLIQGMLTDRLRIGALEEELNSLAAQLSNTYEELSLLDRISGGTHINRRSGDFFHQACLDIIQVVGVRAMGVVLRPDVGAPEHIVCGELQLPKEDVHRLGQQLLASLRQRNTCILIENLAADPDYQWLSSAGNQLIAVPLQRRDQLLGAYFAIDKAAGGFNSGDIKLLISIANESAIYLENTMLFADARELMMGLLHSLTSAVDAKDAYTCGHSERVALLSRRLATRIGLPDAQIERIYMAGLLHDVGKIGVPESVLQNTGRLSAEEFEQMKKHPQIGARILSDVRQLEDIIPGVLHHHERYDGRGYPTGLAGQDIPLMGRIICLADCFDAMTSNRTYRKGLPLEVALIEIRRCAGTQFDPALAEAFLQITPDEFRLLLQDHQHQAKKLLDMQQTLRAA
jgi:HD-GYP domain-containing protein (c-di-GMP phosphodiesterase class II)